MLLLRFAIYPGGASRYIKHVDNTLGTDGRRLTAVLYLNRHWSLGGEGGEKYMETGKPASCDRRESSKLFELEDILAACAWQESLALDFDFSTCQQVN